MTTMKRWEMEGLGRENLRLRDVPAPEPRAGEVLVKVEAVSLNYRDKLVIENGMGMALDFPFTPASDLAGTVIALGEGVTRFRTGDRVISTFFPGWIDGKAAGSARLPSGGSLGGAHPGVLAEYVAFPEDWFVAAPKSLDAAGASTLPCAGLTAWFALVERGTLKPGESVLVQGTGGVALFGQQIAKALGAEAFVTSGSAEKLARAKALGADHAVTREGWVDAVYRLTGDRGIDHVLEIVGGAHLARALEAVAVGGRVSVIGVLDGYEVSGPASHLLRKSAVVQGISVGHRRALEDLVRAVDVTGLKPVIDRRYALDDLPAVLDQLDRGPFVEQVSEAMGRRRETLIERGDAIRQNDGQTAYRRNPTATVQEREVARVGEELAVRKALPFRAAADGGTITGAFTGTVQLSSGKFAIVEKSYEFTLSRGGRSSTGKSAVIPTGIANDRLASATARRRSCGVTASTSHRRRQLV